jgi:hypothetical protein
MYQDQALIAYCFGLRNKQVFKVRRDRGRPPGPAIDDTAALEAMKQLAEKTGETSPRRLAQHVVESGCVRMTGEKESMIRRLDERYRRRYSL